MTYSGMELIRTYECEEEKNLSSFVVPETSDSDTDTSETSVWSSRISITSHFSSFTSETNEIDNAVKEIMQRDNSTEENNNAQHVLTMFVIDSLNEQIGRLKEEVTFLRAESNTKKQYDRATDERKLAVRKSVPREHPFGDQQLPRTTDGGQKQAYRFW